MEIFELISQLKIW